MSHTATCDLLGEHGHDDPAPARSTARRDDTAERRQANRAVAVSAVGLVVTGALELALAVVTGSVALLADALHNLSDVASSAIVFIGFRVSKRKPSPSYPYGYERAEDLAGLGIALLIWASAALAGVESYRKLVGQQPTTLVGLGMAGAALGIVGNQLVARYKLTVGRRIHSAALVVDAKHSWLDAISSLGALVGLGLVAVGQRWGDPLAGFAVTAFIVHVGWEVTRDMARHLMDGVDPDELTAARAAATTVPGVTEASAKGRWTGRSLHLEVDYTVDAGLPLSAVERIGRQVETAVLDAVPAARQVRRTPHPR